MKIALGVAQFHPGNPADYLDRAAKKLGHSSAILNTTEFAQAFGAKSYDLYIGVDSGEPIDYSLPEFSLGDGSKLAHWFIDFRHNKDRSSRKPTDLESAKLLSARGSLICQAQVEDALECYRLGYSHTLWLPLAADTEIWSHTPAQGKRFEVGFVGSIWDTSRLSALREIEQAGIKLGFPGPGKSWKEGAAQFMRECLVGFNINSFYGTAFAFDINMRVFETLACGVPLVTNWVPSLAALFGETPPFILTYKSAHEIVPTIQAALANEKFLQSGPLARDWIVKHATYEQRLLKLIDSLRPATKGNAPLSSTAVGLSASKLPLPAAHWVAANPRFGQIGHLTQRKPGRPLEVTTVASGQLIGTPVAISVAPDGTALYESTFYPQMLGAAAGSAIRSPHAATGVVPRKIAGPVLPLCGLWAGEFWHWVMEYLPRLMATELSGARPTLILDESTPPFVTESLTLLGIAPERLVRVGSQPLQCEQLVLPQTLRGSVELLQHQELLIELRARMLKSVTASSSPQKQRRLFLSRSKAKKGRTIKNEAELLATLVPLGFEAIHLETLSFKEQVEAISQSSTIVGPHGAGFVHSLWMPERSLVIEIFSPYFVHPACRAGCRVLNHRHASLLGVADEPAPRTEQEANDRDIEVDVGRVKAILERELSSQKSG